MSECNFCVLNGIRRRAKEQGLVVTVKKARGGLPGGGPPGLDVYVHPKDVEIKFTEEDESPFFVAWLWEIGERCEC